MKTLIVAASTATLVAALAACGSSGESATPTASVESATASGAVASVEACPEGAPARGILRGDLFSGDGAFGTIRNDTGGTLWLWSVKRDVATPCRLDAGKGAGYASRTVGTVYSSGVAPWVPDGWEPGVFWVLATSSPDMNSPGVALGALDPYIGTPSAGSVYRAPNGSRCERDDVTLKTGALGEDREYRLKGDSQGSVLVKRFPDSAPIAREWTGDSKADDWARLDFSVSQIGRC